MSVFIDTNVPMYASGAPHALKRPCREIALLAAEYPTEFVTDAEVLQEMLHRYMAQRTLLQGIIAIREFEELMRDRITPITAEDVLLASLFGTTGAIGELSARDLIHLAVMRRLGIDRIVSADQGFDAVPGIERLDPDRLGEWQDSVIG